MSREYTYGHWSLNLFEKLSLPLKVMTSNKPDTATKLPVVRGLNGRKTRQIQVLLKEGHEQLKSLKDIEDFAVSWTDLETYLTGEDGSLKPFSSYEGLEELVAENEEKKSDKNMEVLGFYDLDQLSPKYFDGRQYYTRSGLQGEKVSQPINVQMYQCLVSFLEKNRKYILVRYFTRSGEEIGALYTDNDYIRLSGLHSTSELREIPSQTKVTDVPEVTKLFSKKIKELMNSLPETPDLSLDWYEFYLNALERKGCFEGLNKPKTRKRKAQETTGSSLMELLSGLSSEIAEENKSVKESPKKKKSKSKSSKVSKKSEKKKSKDSEKKKRLESDESDSE
jgi:non-homologous end joining protein Ku